MLGRSLIAVAVVSLLVLSLAFKAEADLSYNVFLATTNKYVQMDNLSKDEQTRLVNACIALGEVASSREEIEESSQIFISLLTRKDWPERLAGAVGIQCLAVNCNDSSLLDEVRLAIENALVNERDNQTKIGMLYALGEISNAESLDIITPFIDDLGVVKGKLRFYENKDMKVCDAAIWAIETIAHKNKQGSLEKKQDVQYYAPVIPSGFAFDAQENIM